MVFINLPQNANYSKTSKKLEHVWLSLKVKKKKKLSSVLLASFVEVRSNALLKYQAHNINFMNCSSSGLELNLADMRSKFSVPHPACLRGTNYFLMELCYE